MALRVAFRDNTIAREEDLPSPWVYYPGHYGAFIGFRQDLQSPITFCECARKAIENYLVFRMAGASPEPVMKDNPEKEFVLSSRDFPRALVHYLANSQASVGVEISSHLIFLKHLCHLCNHQTPSVRFCSKQYGSGIQQSHGWYCRQKAFELGMEPRSLRIIAEDCPKEIMDLLGMDIEELMRFRRTALKVSWKTAAVIDRQVEERKGRVRKYVEYQVNVAITKKD